MSTDRYYIRAGQESARRVRDALGLGEQPIPDLVELVERLGFPVIFQPLPGDMHGFTVRDEREGEPTRVIVVSTHGPWTLQRYTLAHELCHALYDDPGQIIIDLVVIPDRLPELRAEQFARFLLLPASALRRDVTRAQAANTPWDNLVAQLMVRWGMSRKAIVRSLTDDGLATPADLTAVEQRLIPELMARTGLTAAWHELCRDQETTSGSPWLVARAVEAYGKGWVGVHVVADLLGQDLTTTRQQLIEQGWASPDTIGC
jgi:Zn-dependent peptidase ImmA (M78 family)